MQDWEQQKAKEELFEKKNDKIQIYFLKNFCHMYTHVNTDIIQEVTGISRKMMVVETGMMAMEMDRLVICLWKQNQQYLVRLDERNKGQKGIKNNIWVSF